MKGGRGNVSVSQTDNFRLGEVEYPRLVAKRCSADLIVNKPIDNGLRKNVCSLRKYYLLCRFLLRC